MVELASTKWNIWWGWSTRWRSAWRRRWWWWNWFLSVQWELRFRSGTLEWSLRSCLGPTGTRGPRSTSWRLMGSSGKLDLVTMTDVIVIIILLWSIESDMAVVPTPLLELIQRARSCTSSSTTATKALISHRWERGKLFLWTLLSGFKQV